MRIINVRNVHQALPEGIYQLRNSGVTQGSRNGPVRVLMDPVTTKYSHPCERVLFHPERDANPFFHLMESLWMLDGRNDVAWLGSILPRMNSYSDDGQTFHGAYGHRWRVAFGYDQLEEIAELLKNEPDTRRAVLQIWSPQDLKDQWSKDLPCNTQVYFKNWRLSYDNYLTMTVCNRSNDIIWGAYGANAVHFSMLQEVLAKSIGWRVGAYWQISNNFHAYRDIFDKMLPMIGSVSDGFSKRIRCPYENEEVEPYPVMSVDPATWFQELRIFLEEGPVLGLREPFFRHVAAPMFESYRTYQSLKGTERYTEAAKIAKRCKASDWRKAAIEWYDRRLKRHTVMADDGVSYE